MSVRADMDALEELLDYLETDTARYIAEVIARLDVLEQPHSFKMAENATRYVWRTSNDEQVRPAHAANNGRVFTRDNPPATGHPGEDFNCRCWAEPVDGSQFVQQTLISEVRDNPDRWTNEDFLFHYLFGNSEDVTLQQSGYLRNIIDYYATEVIAQDGQKGVYRRVNQQVIDAAMESDVGELNYDFNSSYNFREVLFTLRNSKVAGEFNGSVRKEKQGQDEYLVISGVIGYDFNDQFTDPLSFVEIQTRIFGVERGEAEERVRRLADIFGEVYPIKGNWKTKFNAAVKLQNDNG